MQHLSTAEIAQVYGGLLFRDPFQLCMSLILRDGRLKAVLMQQPTPSNVNG
ncbi:hypothetical protein ACUHMQ_16560 [Chitinimonas sp. PSY-7]|uniref:hypothetical protein n=1 Tax=Chitinimonas sp. PSY-7 TaxID=3459088 RepID=UPI0040402BF6